MTVRYHWVTWIARRTGRAVVAGGAAVTVMLAVAVGPAAGPAAGAVAARPPRTPLLGLDISAYQHIGATINWGMLARDGVRFVAIKVAEGTYYTNPYYRADARWAARAGLHILPYVFANPSRSGGPATASFAVLAARYQRRAGTLPLAVDLENDPYHRADCYQRGPARMISWIAGFIARARQLTGKWPVIYTTNAWWRECTASTGRFRSDPLWLAAWDTGRPAVPWPWPAWAFWQYDNHGFLSGIGLTDLDYFQPGGGLSSLYPEPRAKPGPGHRHRKAKPGKHRKSSKHHQPKKRHQPKKKPRPKPKKRPRPKSGPKHGPAHKRRAPPKHKQPEWRLPAH